MPTSISLLSNNTSKSSNRSTINVVPSNNQNSPNSIFFQPNIISLLSNIQTNYIQNNANNTYQNMPSSIETYLSLYKSISQQELSTGAGNLKNLLTMIEYALKGATTAYALNNENIGYTIKNAALQKQIDDILSNKNVITTTGDATGGYAASKSFTLIPLYSYYILVYGLPAQGAGFDPNKLSLINNALVKNNINPYA